MGDQADERQKRFEWLSVLLIIIVALFVRLYALDVFPDTINPDEADNAQDALRIIAGLPPEGGFFGLDWKPQPAYSVYLISIAMRLFGENVTAIRLPSALIGALSVLPFFLLVRRQTSAFAALAASFLMITNLWHVHFSRSGWENVQVPTYALGALACFVGAVDVLRAPGQSLRRAWALFIAAGVFCAFGLYSYFSGRLIIIVLLAFAIPLLARERQIRRMLLIGYGLMTLTALVLFVPMAPVILRDWEFFNQRSATVFLLAKPEFWQSPFTMLGSQIGDTLSMLWGEAEANNLRYAPIRQALLEPIIRLFVISGMLLSLLLPALRRRFETWLWWMLLLIGWFVTQVLTTRTPDPARGTLIIPVYFFFVALAISWIAQAITHWARRVRLPIMGFGLLLIITIAVTNISRYIEWQSLPEVRDARKPYVLLEELPAWIQVVKERAQRAETVITVDEWRTTGGVITAAPPVPTPSPQAPVIEQTAPVPAISSSARIIDPPIDPAETWPQPILTIDRQIGDRMIVPRSIAIDPSGSIYILDSTPTQQTILKMGSDGQLITSWGGPGGPDDVGRFVEAWVLAVDQAGQVLVLDSETGWVQVFDSNGRFLRRWGGPDLRLYKPRAMTIGPDGLIYIADTGGRRVLAISPDGVQQRSYGDSASGATDDAILIEPAGLAVTADGTLLVADAKAGVIRLYAADGALLELWAIGMEVATDGPRLAISPDETITITIPSRCAILRLSPDGQTAHRSGSCEQRSYFDQPSAVAFTADGHYLVSDLRQGKIVLFQP